MAGCQGSNNFSDNISEPNPEIEIKRYLERQAENFVIARSTVSIDRNSNESETVYIKVKNSNNDFESCNAGPLVECPNFYIELVNAQGEMTEMNEFQLVGPGFENISELDFEKIQAYEISVTESVQPEIYYMKISLGEGHNESYRDILSISVE